MDKKIIQRNLPLKQKYTLMGVSYVGDDYSTCENCGRPISNVAHIKGKDDEHNYYIGLDCMDSILENNQLLDNEDYFKYQYSDKPAIQKAKSLRTKLLKKKKEDDSFQAFLHLVSNGKRFGFDFSKSNPSSSDGRDPLGWDYTFDITYLDLTLKYVEGLYTKENE